MDTYSKWTRGHPDRLMFDMLCRRAGDAIIDYWGKIIEIIGECIMHEKDIEMRM